MYVFDSLHRIDNRKDQEWWSMVVLLTGVGPDNNEIPFDHFYGIFVKCSNQLKHYFPCQIRDRHVLYLAPGISL